MHTTPTTDEPPGIWVRIVLAFSIVAPLLIRAPGHNYISADLQSFAIAVGAFALALGVARVVGSEANAPYLNWSWAREGWLLGFGLLMAASWGTAQEPTASLQAVLRWSQPALVFLTVPILIRSIASTRRLLAGTAGAGAVLAIAFVAQSTLWSPSLPVPIVLWPFSHPPNIMAAILILPLFAGMALMRDQRARFRTLFGYAPCVVITLALLLTRSRGAWLGIAVGAGLALCPDLWRRSTPRSALRSLASALALLALLTGVATWISKQRGAPTPIDTVASLGDPNRGSAGGRLRRWANSLPLIASHPILGVGPGNWTAVYPRFRGRATPDASGDPLPYNSAVGLAAEAGVPACFAFAMFFVAVFRSRTGATSPSDSWTAACLCAALAALLVTSLVHDVLRNQLLLTIVFATAGLIVSRDRRASPVGRRAELGATMLMVVLTGGGLVAEYQHLRASLHHGMLVERVAYDGPGLKLAPHASPSGLGDAMNWYFSAFESPGEELWELWKSQRTIRARSPALVIAEREAEIGECDDAEAWIARVLSSNPQPDAWRLSGDCARQRGELVTALAAYDHGIELNPAIPELHARRADTLLDLASPQEALLAYETAHRLFRGHIDGRFGSSSIPLAQRDADELYHISTRRRVARDQLGRVRSSADIVAEIAETPLLHKGLTRRQDRLVFASNLAGRFDLWEVDVGSPGGASAPRLLTRDSLSTFRPRAHPDGRRIYFVSDTDGDYRYRLYERDLIAGRLRPLTPPFVGRESEFELSADGGTLVTKREVGASNDLYLIDSDDRSYRRVTSNGLPKRDVAFSSDGSTIVWVEGEREIVLLDVASSSRSVAVQQKDATLRWPRFSPDGNQIVFVTIEPNGNRTLSLKDLSSGIERSVTSDSRTWLEPTWVERNLLTVRERVGDEYLLAQVDLRTGTVRRIGPESGVVYPVISLEHESDSRLAYAYGGATVPIRLESLDLKSNTREPLLRVEDFRPSEIVVHESLRLPGSTESPRAYVYAPPDPPPGGAPAILWLHGASAEFSPRWHTYAQAFAQAGFVFAAVNERHDNPARADTTRQRAHDAIALRDELARRPGVDAERIFAIGVSAGTRVVHYALTLRPDAFAAVVEYSPVPRLTWDEPRAELPPFLVFLAENDLSLSVSARTAELQAQRQTGTRVEWTVLEREGHDVRGREAIERRLADTISFLRSIRR